MADTCGAGNGATLCTAPQSSFSFTSEKFVSHILIPTLCFAPLATLLLLPLLWHIAGPTLGWYLRKKTDGRRSHIIDLVQSDEKKYKESRRTSTSSGIEGGSREDGGWEKLDTQTNGVAEGRETTVDGDWDGIVGFFHPFW